MVVGVDDHGEVELLRIRVRELGASTRPPLHRRSHAVAVTEVDVVAHAQLVAVVDDRGARQRHQQHVEQFDAAAVVAEQGRETATDADVDPHLRIGGVGAIHVVALLVGDHLEGELVVVAQEQHPLAALVDLRCLGEDVDDRLAILHLQSHVQPGHHGEVERRVALGAPGGDVAEVGHRVLGPLVRFGEQHAAREALVDVGPHPGEVLVGLGEVLAVGAVALEQVGNGVEAHAVDAQLEPAIDDAQHDLLDLGVVVVEVGLV